MAYSVGQDSEPDGFASAAVVKLWKAAKAKNERAQADLIELDMRTGAGIGELSALKVEKAIRSTIKVPRRWPNRAEE
jgi:hypothetical protein